MGHNARQQGRLDSQILGHGLYHPVALGQLRQVVVEVAGRDERGQRWLIEGGRLGSAEGFHCRQRQPVARAVSSRDHVEQQRWDAGVGQVGGNAGTHGSCPQHRGAANQERLSGKTGSGSCGRGSRAHAGSPSSGLEWAAIHRAETIAAYGRARGGVKNSECRSKARRH